MQNILSILSLIIGIGGGSGAIVYFFTIKSKKKIAELEAKDKKLDVELHKSENELKIEENKLEVEKKNSERIDNAFNIILEQKEANLHLSINLKEVEKKLHLLQIDYDFIRNENGEIKAKNAELLERIKNVLGFSCRNFECKKREKILQINN